MLRVIAGWVAASLLAVAASSPQSKPRPEPLWKRILRLAGLATNPVHFRGGQDLSKAGDLMVYDRDRGSRCQITSGRDCRSPIFLPGDEFILALCGGQLVRLPLAGGPGQPTPVKVQPARLVAAGDGSVLVFLEDNSLAVLDLRSGEAALLPGELSDADLQLLELYRGPSRTYDDRLQLEVAPREDRSGLFPLRWSDVFLSEGGKRINVSDCEGAPCGQPALSFDRRRVVYVKGPMGR